MEGVIEGRIVHYVMANEEHRPAIIVRVWDKRTGYVNLQVFTDGSNDGPESMAGIRWEASVQSDEEHKNPRSWHWIEQS